MFDLFFFIYHYYHSDECMSIFRARNLSSYSSPFSATNWTNDSTDVGINSWSEKTIQNVYQHQKQQTDFKYIYFFINCAKINL